MTLRLQAAIQTPRVQQAAQRLLELTLTAIEHLRHLDDGLYERFVATRNAPANQELAESSMRALWEVTFHGVDTLLTFTATLEADRPAAAQDAGDDFSFGDFVEAAPAQPEFELDGDLDGLLDEAIDNTRAPDEDDAAKWNKVVEKVLSIEYGLRAQLKDARERMDVMLTGHDVNAVLGLIDSTADAISEGVRALVAAVYGAFLPNVELSEMVPGFLTALDRALLIRRGLAELAATLNPLNDVLQTDEADRHEQAMTGVRDAMTAFIATDVCHSLRAADRWQLEEFSRELNEQPLRAARLTSEGLAKYLESLSSVSRREVLLVHDQKALDAMRESLANARQLVALSPRTARQEIEYAHQAAGRLRGRSPPLDTMLASLVPPVMWDRTECMSFIEQLEAVLQNA